METIASFEVDHTVLTPGIYLSRVDWGIRTYDLRVTVPNRDFLPNPAMHTIEHLFAVHARNGAEGEKVIYFGPMGCRTGFYLLLIHATDEQAVNLIRETFEFIASYEGDIPGTSEKECGNYREHDLPEAKRIAEKYLKVIRDWTADDLSY